MLTQLDGPQARILTFVWVLAAACILEGSIRPSGDLRLLGSGQLRLAADNSLWNGNIQFDGGTLEVWNTAALGTGSGGPEDFTQVNSGGNLKVRGSLSREPIRLNGGTLSAVGINSQTSPAISSNIELQTNSNVAGPENIPASPGVLGLSGVISGSGGLSTSG